MVTPPPTAKVPQEAYHEQSPDLSLFQSSGENTTKPVASRLPSSNSTSGGSSTQLKGVPSDIVLPSVNEYLPSANPISEGITWDSIVVDWKNDWKKSTSPALKIQTVLGTRRIQCQICKRNWKNFFEGANRMAPPATRTKGFSNLEDRISRKIREADYIEELDATYETLQENL